MAAQDIAWQAMTKEEIFAKIDSSEYGLNTNESKRIGNLSHADELFPGKAHQHGLNLVVFNALVAI